MSINQAFCSPSQFCIECHCVIKLLKCLPPNHLFGRPWKWITNADTTQPTPNSLTLVMSYQKYIILCEFSKDCQTVSFILKLTTLIHFVWQSSAGVPSLIFSNGRDLLIADVHGHNAQTLVESQNRGVAVGVDFHYQLQRVFWTDTIQNKVKWTTG